MQKRLRISDKEGTSKYKEYLAERGLEIYRDYHITLGFNPRTLGYDHYVIQFEDEVDLLAFSLAFNKSIHED